ncbi:type II toxin-antitoxin system VapC family toxin [Candidatus Electronema sp. JM]|uniref:type II toxin-antitoxin system VapC family toxin n=1 Tax=Candidatus Electronema sp. JM TaxID=3401571 RepID=UPI003AA7C434
MKSVYIESSVISYMTARPSRDVITSARQAITFEWWDAYKDRFEIFISELVIEEISSGDMAAAQKRLLTVEDVPVLETTGQAVQLAKLLIAENAVPESCSEDAMHISIAAVHGMDFLLTWNFKHINNANTREKIAKIITKVQLKSPVLCSPEELVNER